MAYAILHRIFEIGQFLQSYPKRAFANPAAFFALHDDQTNSYFDCFKGSEMLAYKKQQPETIK